MEAQADTFRDSIATVDKQGKRNWIYVQQPKGKLYRYRVMLSYVYFVLFFSLPFIQVNGRPLFMFNVVEGKFILFGAIFWPQDFFLFGLAMMAFILFIALFTMAFGRLFCGWACPQTIFMEMLFRRIEYWIEGDAAAQRLLNKGPWTADKVRKKAFKHILFFALSFGIANIFLAYIISMKELGHIVRDPLSAHVGGFITIVAFSGVFYGVFAFMREQVCTTVCPYGRLQGVLLDRNSVIVAYDYRRGEPRGKFKKNEERQIGDCIDCMQCVKVCPTGIDIRNGTQLECVNCTACIDACNFMMEKTGLPKGLIRYASENGIAEKQPLRFTPRLKVYTLVLTAILGAIGYLLLSRQPVSGTVMRAAGMLYQERGVDSVSNLYRIKLVNKTAHNLQLQLRLTDAGGQLIMVGHDRVPVKADGQGEGTFFIVLPRQAITRRKSTVHITMYAGHQKVGQLKTTFLGPVAAGSH
ncbi:cytochrome c oxidase accessory protein CcoG [Chitinophaga japonensis]|uniref:Cytochrome c oxidase accessory protein FixG n=1 Tax=Chitinophaga japonensis TaxID=104662 RepID=A0A562SSN5_CHIJA|nr:cytochrome c oxidase accessory protein CcoG [Chitinophaga japonensis]TWI84118.1 cytochrome c oxidase accessory protein FixG [Chitinophaga japonensis]